MSDVHSGLRDETGGPEFLWPSFEKMLHHAFDELVALNPTWRTATVDLKDAASWLRSRAAKRESNPAERDALELAIAVMGDYARRLPGEHRDEAMQNRQTLRGLYARLYELEHDEPVDSNAEQS